MILARVTIECLLKKQCPYNHELISSMKLNLTLFVAYSKAYDEVWNSIYWNNSNVATKNRVRQKLHRLAFDAMTSLLEAAQLYNQFLDYCALHNLANYSWLGYTSYALKDAYNILLKEHPSEVNSIQLLLL